MFKVLVSLPVHCHRVLLVRPKRPSAQPWVGFSGSVDHDRAVVFTHFKGQRILCRSGNLWLTVENDRTDHVLAQGQDYQVATQGKVILTGRGEFMI